MTLLVGSSETVTLDVSPYDTDTAVALVLYNPQGVSVPPVEPVGLIAGHAEAVVSYDAPGPWLQFWTVTGTGAGVTHRTVYVADALPSEVVPPSPLTWPPTLEMLKGDLSIDPLDETQDIALAGELSAAIAFVLRVRGADFNFADESGSTLPDPHEDLVLGTLRLAGRWQARRRSPDGLVSSAELGSSRVASFDPDIDRLLGVGRFAGPVIA